MTNAAMGGPVYALNLFNVADRDEYLAYSRWLPRVFRDSAAIEKAYDMISDAVETSKIKP